MAGINGINFAAVVLLILINVIAASKGIAGSMESKTPVVNVFEQLGRYGYMALMILPVGVREWKFGFRSIAGMMAWLLLTIILLAVYAVLWMRKKQGKSAVLYGLAMIPVCLFLVNGILLRLMLLILFAVVFGLCHLKIVRESVAKCQL